MGAPKKAIQERFPEMWQAWELRAKGLSLRAIAREMGCSHEQVRKLLDLSSKAVLLPGIENYRKMEDERLGQLLEALQPKIQRGDTRAIEVAIKLLERRAKLHGLDKPIEHNVTVQEITEYDRELAELAREAMMRRQYGTQPEGAGLD